MADKGQRHDSLWALRNVCSSSSENLYDRGKGFEHANIHPGILRSNTDRGRKTGEGKRRKRWGLQFEKQSPGERLNQKGIHRMFWMDHKLRRAEKTCGGVRKGRGTDVQASN